VKKYARVRDPQADALLATADDYPGRELRQQGDVTEATSLALGCPSLLVPAFDEPAAMSTVAVLYRYESVR
jgi:hypothetical protein